MNYKFFTNSQKAWKAMFEAMVLAEKSIYLEMYIFQNDTPEFNFFELLKNKAKEGLKVCLILDSLGSSGLDGDAIRDLDQAGVEVLSPSYILHRMHKKILIVDENIAFIGGVNIEQSSRLWNDLMVGIKGNLVSKMLASFAKSYAHAGGKDAILIGKNSKITTEETNSWIVEHSPRRKKFIFKKLYKAYLNKAKENITLVTPYFIPKRWLRRAIRKAVARGVNVEILVPKTTDHFIIDRVNYFYIYKLSKRGIKFYIKNDMNHAKAVIIDGKEAMVGSQNLDFLSFDFNSEIGIFFRDKEVVKKLTEITDEWRKGSTLFDPKTHKPKWFDYVLSPFINLSSLFYRIFLD